MYYCRNTTPSCLTNQIPIWNTKTCEIGDKFAILIKHVRSLYARDWANNIDWALTDNDDYNGEYPMLVSGPNQTRIGREPAISVLISNTNEDT